MDRPRLILSPQDELKQIRSDIKASGSLEAVRTLFERLQELRRQYVDDFDLQVDIADAQQEIIERARFLRAQANPESLSSEQLDDESRVSGEIEADDAPNVTPKTDASGGASVTQTPVPDPVLGEDAAEIPADVPKLDHKSWRLAVGLAILFTVGICALFFYMIQVARRINFSNDPPAVTTGPQTPNANAAAKGVPVSVPPADVHPTLRLYTDLTAGTATIDDQPPRDLADGELDLNSFAPGVHTVKVESRSGSAAFTFALDNDKDVPHPTQILKSSNSMLVLVAVKDGAGKLTADTTGAVVDLDGKPAGVVAAEGLLLPDLGNKDHNLQVTRLRDRQQFVLTYTAAPTLTVFVKSDPSTGVITVSTGQDGVSVSINDVVYKRLTDHGQVRIPLKVGTYRIGVHKDGFQDPPVAVVEVKKSAEVAVQFTLEPVVQAAVELNLATLQIKGAQPGITAYIDHQQTATVGPDGTAKVVNIKPGDHLIELRHDQAVTRQLTRSFTANQTLTLSGVDVALDHLAADNKTVIPANPGTAMLPPPEIPHLEPSAPPTAGTEQVHKGGGFIPYHAPAAGRYYFQARTKIGGVLKRGKLEWYAGFHDTDNYVLYSLDGKHAEVKEVRDGKPVVVGRIPFPISSEQWAELEVVVKADTLQGRVKTGGADWIDLAPVSSPSRDFTKDTVGVYIPSNAEVSVANFRYSSH